MELKFYTNSYSLFINEFKLEFFFVIWAKINCLQHIPTQNMACLLASPEELDKIEKIKNALSSLDQC